ncbi:MAG TPA: NRDE family protein [Candidatus Eisenbacteria bacterium]|nr:NRDE family protein [Candidatus Eisenbacteria bacterium]
MFPARRLAIVRAAILMCTLLVHVPANPREALWLGANRDEAYERPSDDPAWLARDPWIWGGRDREAGGTWLCARASAPSRLVAVLNRPPRPGSDPHAPPPPDGSKRSRGLLCLEAAGAATRSLAEEEAHRQVEVHGSAPFNLFLADAEFVRVAAYDGHALTWRSLAPGWHALTHGDPDDASDQRVARALRELEGAAPGFEALVRVLAENEGHGAACRHGERYGTVSSSVVRADLQQAVFDWRYAAGPPCHTPYVETLVRLPS